MQIGIYTFGEAGTDSISGNSISPSQRLRDLVEEIVLADQVGLDMFGLGEHHRADYAVSSPVVALAAAATQTKNIRLSSAVTVLSSDDPIRVFQQFSTLDNLTQGRAEIMVGRGAFVESFPLFGHNLDDYDRLFAEKLQVLMAVNEAEHFSWPGTKHIAAVDHRGVYPRPFQDRLPIWLAVGGTPQSAVRAGTLGLPLALGIIGGEPARFKPLFDVYRNAATKAGHDPAKLETSLNVHGFVADTSQKARDIYSGPHNEVMTRLGAERGWPPATRPQFDVSCSPTGALFVGDPAELTDKILAHHEIFGFTRITIQMAVGILDHKSLMNAIEILGTRVAPEVRKALGPQ